MYDTLRDFLDDTLGGCIPITVTPMIGGGSCEVFAIDRGSSRWVLRRAPRHASSATAHDVLREFRILDAIKDQDGPDRSARARVRRHRGVRGTLLRDGADRRVAHPSGGA